MEKPGPTSFRELRTVAGVECSTFVEAAERLGLMESDEVFARAMKDACDEKMNFKSLQHYFAMLIVHASPSNPQKLFDEFLDEMNPPVISNNPKSLERRKGEVMRNLEYYFNCMGKTSR